jgi:hypothetical protein
MMLRTLAWGIILTAVIAVFVAFAYVTYLVPALLVFWGIIAAGCLLGWAVIYLIDNP